MKFLRRIFFTACLALILLLATVNIWLAVNARGRQFDTIADVPHSKTGLLLGTSKYDTTESGRVLDYYRYRIDAAVQLYKAGKVDFILVSSTNAADKNAETMRQDLILAGIPADKIYLDCLGLRTFDSIIRCRKLVSSDSVLIITQKHHGQRALFIAQHTGLHAIAYAAPGDDKLFFDAIWHEQVARLVMLWDIVTYHQ